jgi:hypothetical protein
MQDQSTLPDEKGVPHGVSRDGEAVLFNSAVRALGLSGFSDIEFDIGGKKSRRRNVLATSSKGESCSIWIKSALLWIEMADVLRFPWSKQAVKSDSLQAVVFAADDAIRRGNTHLLAIVGDEFNGKLSLARLYTLEDIKRVATEQKAVCKHPFYIAHGAALIIRSHHEAFDMSEAIARVVGEDVPIMPTTGPISAAPMRARSGRIYGRDGKVRDAVLKMADGHCERCG